MKGSRAESLSPGLERRSGPSELLVFLSFLPRRGCKCMLQMLCHYRKHIFLGWGGGGRNGRVKQGSWERLSILLLPIICPLKSTVSPPALNICSFDTLVSRPNSCQTYNAGFKPLIVIFFAVSNSSLVHLAQGALLQIVNFQIAEYKTLNKNVIKFSGCLLLPSRKYLLMVRVIL